MEEKRGRGQPIKYNQEQLIAKWYEYKQDCLDNDKLANIVGFALFAGVHKDTIYEYFSRPEYSDSKKIIDQGIEELAIQKGINARNPAFLIFYMKNKCGWRDRQEVDLAADVDAQISVKFVPSTEDD